MSEVVTMAAVAVLLVAPGLAAPELPKPVFDARLAAASPDCTYLDYCKRTPQTFSETNGHTVVTFNFVRRDEPKGYDSEWGVMTRAFAVTPGKEGVVRLAFGDDIGQSIRPGGQLFWLDAKGEKLLFQDALGRMMPQTVSLKMPFVTKGERLFTSWTRCLVPDGARQAKIEVKVDNPDLKAGQKASVHCVAFYEFNRGEPHALDDLEAPALEVLTPSPTADFNAPIRFRITDKSGVDLGNTFVKIDRRDVDLATLERDGDAYVYRPSAPWKENSLHEITLAAVDTRGNRGTDSGFVAFTAQASVHPKWTVRDDGMPMKDGQAFFPFGWCRIRPCAGNGFDMDRGVADMLANGLNAGHTYMARRDGARVSGMLDELEAICERRNLLLYVEPSYRNPDDSAFLPLVAKSLFAARASRLSRLWGIGDDTSMHVTPTQLKRYYLACKAADPDTLTVSADVVGGAGLYEPYLPYCDIVAVETYPLGNPVPLDRDMAKSAADIDGAWRDVYAAKIPNRTVFALPQNFKGWRSWKRLPTIEECKAQAYITAACGARGIFFYASTGQKLHLRESSTNIAMSATCPLDDPKFKAEFFAFTREFSALLPSLARRDAAQPPKVNVLRGNPRNVLGGNSIRCLLKEDGLLIAANTSHEEVTAEIVLPNGETLMHVFPRYGYLKHGPRD